jgi:hypothetical protein
LVQSSASSSVEFRISPVSLDSHASLTIHLWTFVSSQFRLITRWRYTRSTCYAGNIWS